MMDIAAGISMVAGIGTVLGTVAERKKMSKMGQAAGYLTGGALMIFSVYEHIQHRNKMRHKWHNRNRRMNKMPCPQSDYRIVGGKERDYSWEQKQRQITMSNQAGGHMWPRREPRGYLTGAGMEQRGLSGSGMYEYPDNVYDMGRTRIAPYGYA
jgi:hypothetical protein